MPVTKPIAEYTVKVYSDSVDVTMKGAKNLNPGKIQRQTRFILDEWQKFQQGEVIALRKHERAIAEEAAKVEAAKAAAETAVEEETDHAA